MDRINAIKTFLTLAQNGSFTATAEELNLSRPKVTRHISLLEDWLNTRLFHRTTRHVTLTQSGEQALLYCQNILNLVEDVETEVFNQSGELQGLLRITASSSFGTTHLMQAVHEFQQLHPKLKINLMLGDNSLNLVQSRVDLAIRITNTPDDNLFARPLSPCHSSLVASPDYLQKMGTPNVPEDLLNHRCLAFSNINRNEWQFIKKGREYEKEDGNDEKDNEKGEDKGNKTVRIALPNNLSCDNAVALLNACMLGSGVTMLPKYAVETAINKGELVPILTDWQLPKMTIYALYASRDKLPRATRLFLDYLVEAFAGRGW